MVMGLRPIKKMGFLMLSTSHTQPTWNRGTEVSPLAPPAPSLHMRLQLRPDLYMESSPDISQPLSLMREKDFGSKGRRLD